MPTRKQLIDQVRADQRQKSIRSRGDNPKSAIVGIGDRDPLTGQYQVMLPDGSVETGEKQFNSSLPKGSQVLGVPQSTGGWLLDERDVHPIESISTSSSGKIKVLFSKIKGDERVFYVGGDRPTPTKIGSIPADAVLRSALIDNKGGKSFIAGITWTTSLAIDLPFARIYSQVMGDEKWVVDEIYDVTGGYNYVSNGFWSKYISGVNIFGGFGPHQILQPITKSLYKNQIETYSGSITTTDSSGGILLNVTESGMKAIAPNITKLVSSELIRHIEGQSIITDSYSASIPFPVAIDKTGKSAIYRVLIATGVNSYSDQYRMIIESNDEVIAGNLPPGQGFISGSPIYSAPYRGNFVNRKYYIAKFDDLNKSTWNVDVYTFSASTTKSTIKAKVTFRSKPGMTIHSASYHP